MRIPKALGPLVAAVEEVRAEFASSGKGRRLDEGHWTWDVGDEWSDPIDHVAYVLDPDAPMLAVYVMLRLPGASSQVDPLARAVARANFGLLPGCFELNLDSGAIRLRSGLFLPTATTGTREVAQLLSNAIVIAQIYAPAFHGIIESGVDPEKAIDAIDRQR
jgi:hypothetical protein